MLIWNRCGFIDRLTGLENHGRESAGSVNLFISRQRGDSAAKTRKNEIINNTKLYLK